MMLQERCGLEGESGGVRSSDTAGKQQRLFETISTSPD